MTKGIAGVKSWVTAYPDTIFRVGDSDNRAPGKREQTSSAPSHCLAALLRSNLQKRPQQEIHKTQD
jgi:hypothetical protein